MWVDKLSLIWYSTFILEGLIILLSIVEISWISSQTLKKNSLLQLEGHFHNYLSLRVRFSYSHIQPFVRCMLLLCFTICKELKKGMTDPTKLFSVQNQIIDTGCFFKSKNVFDFCVSS